MEYGSRMKRLSVTSEGFFNGGKAKPSYNKTRGQYGNQAPPAAAHQSGVSLPRLPPPESGPKAKGSRSGWRSFEKLPHAGGGWHPLPYPKRELEGADGGSSEEDNAANGTASHSNEVQRTQPHVSAPPRHEKQQAARDKNMSTTFSGGFNLDLSGVTGGDGAFPASSSQHYNSGNSGASSTSTAGFHLNGNWQRTSDPSASSSSMNTKVGGGSLMEMDGGGGAGSALDEGAGVDALRQDNERLRRELETLQVGLLQSLKRQDRFISGGQFKGPPAKSQQDKNKMASTHQGSFLADKDEGKRANKASAFHIAELKRYKARVQELTRELQAVRQEQLELSDMRCLIRTLEEENKVLREQIRQLRDEQTRIVGEHEAEIARLKEQVREDNEDLSPVYAEMAQVIAARDGLASELETYRRELMSFREAVAKERVEAETKMKQLEDALAKTATDKQELEASLERWKRKQMDATRRLRELEQESEREAEERDRVHNKALAHLQSDHDVAVKALQAEIAALKEQIAHLQKQITQAKELEREQSSAVQGAREEWEAERIALEHRWKLELQHKESEFSEKLDGQEKEHAASLNDSEARAAAVKKGLEDKCKTLEAEHKEKSKKLYEMALMHFLASAQQKNKGVEEKIVFAVWKSVARDQVAARREAALIREKKEGIDALRKQAEREQNQLRLAVEEDKKNREYLDKLKEEERKKSLVEKLTETQRAERAKCQREHEQASGEQRKIQNALRERNGELEAVIRDLEQKMEALERNVLQRKLQQSMKLQVLAPRVSVTINGDTVNMLDVEVAPSSEDLKGIMHREVLPRFSKILLSEDFDESRTQARVQEVMNEMVSVIENKLQGIFGANCLRTTASM